MNSTAASAGGPPDAVWMLGSGSADNPLHTLPENPEGGGERTPGLTDANGRPLEVVVYRDPATGDLSFHEGPVFGLSDANIVFRWPKAQEVSTLDGLAKHVTLYSDQVGTCLHRKPEGAGEREWCATRTDRWRMVWESRDTSFSAMCSEIVKQFVKTTYTGSEHCQYGNCGEGGHIFMCMAAHGGFSRKHIYNCSSKNDHNFSILWAGSEKKYCVLDRWDIISKGHFFCNAGVKDGTLVHEGQKTTAKWYQDLTCTRSDDRRFGH